ncbi:MAG: hypothetical protein D6718_06615, partial [Acidobacteria bacterium]
MASFGEMLRRERKLRRISLREVAESTKINIRYLEALERNEFDYLPGGAFTVGFIRAYARCIGADDRKMVDAYKLELQEQQARRGEAGLPPAETHEDTAPEARRRRRARLALAAAAILLATALAAG